MRIAGIRPAIAHAPRRAAADRRAPPAAETETRALIAVEAPVLADRTPPRTRHPSAPFLAHLIATHMHAPQTRARRRAEPQEAIAAYARGLGPAPGATLRRQA